MLFTMLHDWYRAARLPMSGDDFRRLPRHPAFGYEYGDGAAQLSPRPKTLNALLPLRSQAPPPSAAVVFRPLTPGDWAAFPELFAAAFRDVQPFAGLDDAECHQAAVQCLDQTRTGGDGPLIPPACFVAEIDGRVAAGMIVTLIPKREPGDWWDGLWVEPPPPDAAARGLARPHLTWVFVAPLYAGHGIGSALLVHAGNALLAIGFTDLASTISLGNESSTLWHWRNGFALMPYPASLRLPQNWSK